MHWLEKIREYDESQPWIFRISGGYLMVVAFLALAAGLLVDGLVG